MKELTHDKARAKAQRAWLKQVAAAGGWRGRAAAVLLVGDGLAAIGFAGALAGALAGLSHGIAAVAPWLALGLAAAVLRGGCAWGGARIGAAGSAAARLVLYRRLMASCLGVAPGGHAAVGDTMTVVVDGVEAIDLYLARFLPARQAAGVVPLLVLAAAALASPVSAAILAATFVPFLMVMALAGGAAGDAASRQFAALRHLSGLFADRVRGLPIVLAFGAGQRETDRIARTAEELRQRTMGVLKVAFVSSAGLEFFAALSVAMVAVYAGFNLLRLLPFPAPERLDLGRAVFVLALAPEFYAPMRRLAAAYHDQKAAQAAADALMTLEASRRPRPVDVVLEAPPCIRFEGVTVRFPEEDCAALENFDCTVAPGEIMVLLGPTGSGKTTALNLLLGLAPLAGGEVWIDGLALSQVGSVAASVSWMGQTSLIIPGSVAENVALSRRDADPPEVALAMQQAGLCTMLKARPEGPHAMIDERGSGLSGGERRRIALARALLKPSPILLLDEPTAHLDALSEAALIRTIQSAAKGRTTIIATHSERLAAIADHVVSLVAS